MKRIAATLCLALAALAAASVLSTAPASAQNFPTQRVTIVVPFGAGSVTDIMARILADDLGKRWNQQVIVENRPGLAGTASVAKADARRLHAAAHLQRPHRREPRQQDRLRSIR